MKPTIIAITGPSCAGKDTLMRQLCMKFSINNKFSDCFSNIRCIVSTTTRLPRKNEVDRRDYYFISEELFDSLIDKGAFLEGTQFRNWKYGTDMRTIDNRSDALNIGVFNLEGIKNLQKYDNYNIIVIYLIVNGKERLRRSIKREGRLTFEMIRRMFADGKDFKRPFEILGKSKLLAYTKDYNIDQIAQDIMGKIE